MKKSLFLFVSAAALVCCGEMCLNGSWEFAFKEGKSIAEVADPAFKSTDIMSVPGCYDMMPNWLCKRGTGLYRRTFTLDKAVDNAWIVVDGMPVWSSGFPYLLQFQSEFGNEEFMI